LLRKFETAKEKVPKPIARPNVHATRFGAIYYGSTSPAMHEALDLLDAAGLHLDAMRVRAFPFADEVMEFIAAHDVLFVVEQNRDAQLRTLIINEGAIDPAVLTPVLHYDGTPITARFIANEISQKLNVLHVAPLHSVTPKRLSQESK
jgi:2-oxoglutarate ferredoxin oxidoreductase subunit alpha